MTRHDCMSSAARRSTPSSKVTGKQIGSVLDLKAPSTARSYRTLELVQVRQTEKAAICAAFAGPLTDSNRRPPPHHALRPALVATRGTVFSLVSASSRREHVPPVATVGPRPQTLKRRLRARRLGGMGSEGAGVGVQRRLPAEMCIQDV